MCGICGFISDVEIDERTLVAMNDSMAHRGPDNSGIVILKRENRWVGLGHRRLSIIDLSEKANQPMFSSNKDACIIFNGEFYNFKELRKELSSEHSFISKSDTEVLLAAYISYGKSFVKKLNGMFAIAIYDFRSEELILIRDRIGEKPLYYFVDGSHFVFGSELKAILGYPYFNKDIRKDIIAKYLFHSYIEAPCTIFKNTYKLEPGCMLTVKKDGISKRRYWDVYKAFAKNSSSMIYSYKNSKQGLLSLLEDSIKRQMVSDVPLGVLLSGGMDSSLITAIAARNSPKPIETFSVGFKEKTFDEAPYAKKIAQYLGTSHNEVYISENDYSALIQSAPVYFDEPLSDSAIIPTMFVAKLAKEKVSVLLTGDGGDELFCGYNAYAQDRTNQFFYNLYFNAHKLFANSPYLTETLGNAVDFNVDGWLLSDYKIQHGFNEDKLLVERLVNNKSVEVFALENGSINNWQTRHMLMDIKTLLADCFLQKVDKGCMRFSVEPRCPFLDYRLAEYSFRIPHFYKYRFGEKKYILKDILYELIPKPLLDRPKKGFSISMGKLLNTTLKKQLEHFSNTEVLKKQDIFNPPEVKKLLKLGGGVQYNNTYSRYIWSFYMFQLWYDCYIDTL